MSDADATAAPPMLTLDDVARELGVAKSSVYRLCAPVGDLPAVRLSMGESRKRKTRGVIRIRREDFDAWVLKHRSAPASETKARTAEVVRRASVSDLPGANRYLK
jgi:hypothetical protein